MRKYEIMYIIRPTVDENGMKSVIEDVNKIFADFDSKVVSTEEQGLKDLAYEIQKHRKGYYVLLKVEATSDAINEFNRKVRINENIIRFLVINEEE